MTGSADRSVTRRRAVQLGLTALGALGAGSPVALSRTLVAHGEEPGAAAGAFFDPNEMACLAEIAEIVIPATDTPGARAANVHGFIDGLMAEWALPETQAALRAALHAVDTQAREAFGSAFMDLPPPRRVDVVAAVDEATFALLPGPVAIPLHPFARLKDLVFLGYYHSEIGATQELRHAPVPGRYEACVPLSDIGRAWVESR